MMLIRSIYLAFLPLVLAWLPGCGPHSGDRSPAPGPAPQVSPAAHAPATAAVQRLVRDQLAQAKSKNVEPVLIALEPLLQQEREAPFVDFLLASGLDAEKFNSLELSCSAKDEQAWGVAWQSDRLPELPKEPFLKGTLLADGEPHRYTLSLRPFEDERWTGRISALRFWLGKGVDAKSASARLSFVPPAGPRRAPIENVTLEALPGAQVPWKVRIPAQAIFETHVAMAPTRQPSDGADLVVRLRAQGQEQEIARVRAAPFIPGGPGWLPVRADLASHAGQDAELLLQVDHLESAAGDFPLWGDPIVYSNTPSDATPVILVSLDTLRADHLSCYGYARETAPSLDAFAKEAVLFSQAVTPESWTLTAHTSIMTGLHPKSHGVTPNLNLAENIPTLGKTLTETGYLAAAFTGHGTWVAPWRGIGYGFDYYELPPLVDGRYRYRSLYDTLPRAVQWLKDHQPAPLFLFLHSYDAHSKQAEPIYTLPYEILEVEDFHHFSTPPGKTKGLERLLQNGLYGRAFLDLHNSGKLQATPEETEYLKALYDDCIRALDKKMAEFFEQLKQLGLYDRALIVVTADHGESFNEHGTFDHVNMYEEDAHIPLLIKFPGGNYAGKRVESLVTLMDIFPTVLDVLQLPVPQEVEGKSLLGLIEGREEARTETFGQREAFRTLRRPPWKLVVNNAERSAELFNLQEDPGETQDRSSDKPELAASMRKDLDAFFAQPLDGGWTLSFTGGEAASKVSVTAISEEGFTFATMPEADTWYWENVDKFALSADGHSFTAELMLLPGDVDVLRLLPAGTSAPLRLSLAPSAPLEITSTQSVIAQQTPLVLNPADGSTGTVAPGPQARFFSTYEAPQHAGETARQLTEEEQAELEALGYVH